MRRSRISDAVFVLLVGLALGASAWAVSARSGAAFFDLRSLSDRLQRVEDAGPEPRGIIELMIEGGELSDHPARFWRDGSGGER